MSISESDAELIEDLSYRTNRGEHLSTGEVDFLTAMFEADSEAYALCFAEGEERARSDTKIEQ